MSISAYIKDHLKSKKLNFRSLALACKISISEAQNALGDYASSLGESSLKESEIIYCISECTSSSSLGQQNEIAVRLLTQQKYESCKNSLAKNHHKFVYSIEPKESAVSISETEPLTLVQLSKIGYIVYPSIETKDYKKVSSVVLPKIEDKAPILTQPKAENISVVPLEKSTGPVQFKTEEEQVVPVKPKTKPKKPAPNNFFRSTVVSKANLNSPVCSKSLTSAEENSNETTARTPLPSVDISNCAVKTLRTSSHSPPESVAKPGLKVEKRTPRARKAGNIIISSDEEEDDAFKSDNEKLEIEMFADDMSDHEILADEPKNEELKKTSAFNLDTWARSKELQPTTKAVSPTSVEQKPIVGKKGKLKFSSSQFNKSSSSVKEEPSAKKFKSDVESDEVKPTELLPQSLSKPKTASSKQLNISSFFRPKSTN